MRLSNFMLPNCMFGMICGNILRMNKVEFNTHNFLIFILFIFIFVGIEGFICRIINKYKG